MTVLKCDVTGKEIKSSQGNTPIRNVDFFTFLDKTLSPEGKAQVEEVVNTTFVKKGQGNYSLKGYKDTLKAALKKLCK